MSAASLVKFVKVLINAGNLIGIRFLRVACVDSLGDFKYSKQSQGSQHADAERRPRFNHIPDHLADASHDHLRAERSQLNHQCESDT